MRYSEIANNTSMLSDEEFLKRISTECSDILKYYKKGKVLYRGLDENSTYVEGEATKKRTPMNMEEVLSVNIDSWLSEHGFKAIRNNSYFATSKKEDASFYGNPYVIFPKNGFEYTWFINSNDLYYTASEMDNYPDIDINYLMKEVKPSQNNLLIAINSGKELMFTGSYYAINGKQFTRRMLQSLYT